MPTAKIVPVLLITALVIVLGVIEVLLHQLFAVKVDAELVAIYNVVVEAAIAYCPLTFIAKHVQFWSPSVTTVVVSLANEVDPPTPVNRFVPLPPTIICCPSPEKVAAVAVAILILFKLENDPP